MKTQGRRAVLGGLVVFALLLLTGCSGPGRDQRALVEDFSEIALQKERANLRCERALALGGDYMSGNAGAQETDEALEELYTENMAEYTALEKLELSPELEGLIRRCGIDPVDYAYMADECIENLYNDGQELYALRSNILNEDRDTLSWWLDLRGRLRALQVEYDALAINYLFCGWTGEDLDYVDKEILSRLVPEHRPAEWLENPGEIEERITSCLDLWEEYTWEFARRVESEELAPLGR